MKTNTIEQDRDNLPHQKNALEEVVTQKSAQLFAAAQRHSYFIRKLKIVLPILAVIIGVIFCWFTFFSSPNSTDLVVINRGDLNDGRLTMTNPQLEGYTKNNHRYALKAERAVQDPSRNGLIVLDNITGILPLAERGEATINASGGAYDNINGRLNLTKPFTVKTSDGVVAKLQSADVNIATGQLNTDKLVDIRRGDQHLMAGGLNVRENGKVLFFSGGVTLIIDNAVARR